ncbi:MAG: hypothetical protein OEV12_03060 [Gammaproteobacteria bacterium]|nr:hypothetical protein [Gammaproteobacteria bacterium]
MTSPALVRKRIFRLTGTTMGRSTTRRYHLPPGALPSICCGDVDR